jgi:hypothetical protein
MIGIQSLLDLCGMVAVSPMWSQAARTVLSKPPDSA